jgi:hypothetical protein
MSVYFFLWNPKKDPDSFVDYDEVQRDALAGEPYLTDWICPSTRPEPGDLAILQRTGTKYNGVFATGIVTRGTFEDEDGVKRVELSLDSFLPLGQEIPREEIVRRAKYAKNWCPMASGNVVPGPLVRAIDALWEERSESKPERGSPSAS